MNKIVILDPSCVRDSRSHHVNAVTGHARTFHAAGLNVLVCTNASCTIDLPHAENHPVFTYTIYDDVRSNHTSRTMRLLKRPYYYLLKYKSYNLIESFLNHQNFGDSDHIFVPTVDWILFQCLVKLYTSRNNNPALHLLLMYEKANWMTGGYPYQDIIKIINQLRMAGKNVFIYTETRTHAAHLKDDIGFVPAQYPFPAFPLTMRHEINVPDNYIYVGALGGGRRDKGYHMLVDIVNRFNKSQSDSGKIRFLIQRARPEDRLEQQSALLGKIDNVVLLDNQLTKQEYECNLLKCDIAIFPYSQVYATRGSGIVNESVANAIPIICSKETSLCEAITCKNGIPAKTVNDFVLALKEMIINLDSYKLCAQKARDDFINNLYDNPVILNIRSSIHKQSVQIK